MTDNRIFKKYLKLKNGENDFLRVELYYSLGGMNYFTYKQEARGFYLSVSPVKRERNMESYTAFTGTKLCVHECKRFSKKAAEQAEEKAKTSEKGLIDYVLKKQGLELADEVEQ